jgi:stress response protein SCP2
MAAVPKLRRLNTAGMAEDFELTKPRYGFGVSWDSPPGMPKVDVDLQCVVVDKAGSIIDCAYYNNMKAVRAITHSGDESTGDKSGIDEMVWANLTKLPENVAVLIFVVAAYAGGRLKDVANGMLHVFEENQRSEVAQFDMERSDGAVDVVAAMFRGPRGAWNLRIIDLPAQQGQHFMDVLPLLSEVVRTFIPSAPKRQKVAFAMEKGGVLDLPQTLDEITVGLGWDTDDGEVDLDVSAVLLNARGAEVETVFFGQLESQRHGIKHSGDNLTGAGSGDDEQIQVKLNSIGPDVQQVVFVINIYTNKKTFMQVANPYCRIVDVFSASELCRYSLRDAGRENGLIVAKINREAGNRWGFHALGLPCRGRTYKDSMSSILKVFSQDTHALMARGGSMDLNNAPAAFSMPVASAPPPAGTKKDCVVQ